MNVQATRTNTAYSSAQRVREAEAQKLDDKAKTKRTAPVRDEYVPEDKEANKPTGFYRLTRDKKGSPKIEFDAPQKRPEAADAQVPDAEAPKAEAPKAEAPKAEAPKAEAPAKKASEDDTPEKSAPAAKTETGTIDTDKVDREIEKLRNEKERLARAVRSASADPEKSSELERKLDGVKRQLTLKDNDAYRRQHAIYM